jgi:hypothetical protein
MTAAKCSTWWASGSLLHVELGAGQLHQAPGESVVVDVGVGHDDPGDVRERVPGIMEPSLQCRQPVVVRVGPPDAAVDQRDAIAIGEHVRVHALDAVDADRQRHPGHAVDQLRRRGHRPLLSRASVPAV